MSSDQYLLDFTSRANDRCSKLLGLRVARLSVSLTRGRLEGVIELLQRLVLLSKCLPESLGDEFSVDAQVIAIAARIERRKTACEKTVRNWTADAKLLGLLSVEYASQQYGGSRWNSYTVHFDRVLNLISGRLEPPIEATKGAGNGRQRPVTVTDPGAVTVTDPSIVFSNVSRNHSPPLRTAPAQSSESTKPACSPDWTDQRKAVVVSDLISFGMSKDGACGAVAAAIARELTHAQVYELVERYRTAHLADTHMTVGWLHRWLSGRSRPSENASDRAEGYAHAQTRGDALTRQQVAFETLRAGIVRKGRAAGASEEAIAQRCREAGVEF